MERGAQRSFPEWVKLMTDRICKAEGVSRQELADSLGVHIHSVSTAAYRGEIGFSLVERLAKRAKMTPEELTLIELAWVELRSLRPRDDAVRRCLGMIQALLDHMIKVEDWLRERHLLEAYRKVTRRGPLVRRTISRMKEKR